jgi:hypothetical protein
MDAVASRVGKRRGATVRVATRTAVMVQVANSLVAMGRGD